MVLLVLGPKKGGRRTVVGNMTMPTSGLQQVPMARGPTSYLFPLIGPLVPDSRKFYLQSVVVRTPVIRLVLVRMLNVAQLC